MTLLRWAALFLALPYVAALVATYVFQRAMLYPIPQSARTSPAAAGFPEAEEATVTTKDGERVILWHVPPKADRPVVVFLHGNGDILAWRVARFRALIADGTGLIAVSFRGYAGSTGKPTEAGLLEDGVAAYDFAVVRYSPARVVPWGYSLGSGVAVAMAATRPVGALVLEAPYTSIEDVAASKFPLFPVRWLIHDRFRSDRLIGALKVPLLVMHGERDEVIGVAFGRRLFALAPEPKRFIAFERGTHVDLDEQGAVAAVHAFLNEVGPGRR
jgi:pimeloyl-ACP methyl ester carboxylesterase